VLRRAMAGFTAARDRDGRRVSVITPSGVPFEASVTGGAGEPAATLRYITEAASSARFFAPRLAAQREALAELVGWLPPAARPAATELDEFVAALFPDPGGVPARTRVATWSGIVHRSESPRHIDRLKVYGSLAADEGALARLATTHEQFAELATAIAGLPGHVPHLAAVEVGRSGGTTHKLYVRTDRTDRPSLLSLAERLGADATGLVGDLDRWDTDGTGRARPSGFVCVQVGVDGRQELSMHLSSRALGLDRAAMTELTRKLALRHHGTTAAIDALADAATTAGGTWSHSVVGIGVPAAGATPGTAKLNAYFVRDS
jgi:hypothetical protein